MFLDEMLSASADRLGSRPAIVGPGRDIGYAELYASARRIAAWLNGQGIGPGHLVELAANRTPADITLALATMMCGGAYAPVPADSDATSGLPVERHRWTRVAVRAESSDELPDRVAVDPLTVGDAASPDLWPPGAVDELTAYVMRTSGTVAGTASAVAVSRRAFARYLCSLADRLGVSSSDRMLYLAAPTFSSSMRHMMLPLSAGAATVPLQGPSHDVAAVVAAVERHGVTILDCVPPMFRAITRLAASDRSCRERLRSLRLVAVASDVLSPQDVAEWAQLRIAADLLHMYGTTETCGIVSTHLVRPEDARATNLTIGTAVDGVELELASGDGEVVVASSMLSDGYVDDPRRTADRFRPDPRSDSGARVYHTGDLGRVDGNRELVLIGRRDHRIKVNAVQVDLNELETAIRTLPGPGDALITAERGPGGAFLRCRVVVDGLDAGDVERRVRDVMPAGVPVRIVFVTELPRLPSGKPDRKGAVEEADTPTGEVYPIISDWVRTLTGATVVSGTVSPVELGVNSIQATQLASMANDRFNTRVTLVDVLAAPSLAALAAVVEERAGRPPPTTEDRHDSQSMPVPEMDPARLGITPGGRSPA